jgi:Double zinc ribbon
MPDSMTRPCPACGSPAVGNFCSGCGANLVRRACAHCQAELSPQARFCHRCGQPVGSAAARPKPGASDRKAWLIAGTVCVLLVAGIAYKVSSDAPEPTAPDMANAGSSAGAAGGRPAGSAPDISAMTPRERFDRLYNRIMQASERSDSVEVERFTPMALGAYQQLDSRDADARYHAAVLQMQVGNFPAARALADTIIRESPGHLFGYVIRGTAGRFQNDPATVAQARRDFLAHYETEMRSKRVEYLEHKPVIDEFKNEAEKAVRR